MNTITKCLNEWNAIVEALGMGKQTILIRKYDNRVKEFLLYPTISYAIKDNVLDCFKEKYVDFVKENLLPNSQGNKYEVKYFAKVEKVLKKSPRSVSNLNKFHIWNKNHVNEFVRGKNPYVWVLRVYRIQNPEFLSRTNGMRYANVDKEVDIGNISPVLSDKEFNKIIKEL